MKGTNKQQVRSEKSNVNYKAKFGGEALVTPVAFNPNGDSIKLLKNITSDAVNITDPTYKRTSRLYENDQPVEKEFTVISLMCSFNPNELLKVKNVYADEMFVNHEIYISPEFVKGKDKLDESGNVIPNSAKFQVIDTHNQSAWVKIKPKQKVSDAITEAVQDSATSVYDQVHRIDPATARVACVGEVALYDLLFKMSNFDEHKPDKEQVLDGFVIADKPTEAFKRLCDGDFTVLHQFCQAQQPKSDLGDYFFPEGKQNKIGLLMSVQINKDKSALYQGCYRSETERNIYISNTFRQISGAYEIKTNKELGKTTRLPKDLIKHLTDAKYPWKGEYGAYLAFKEITLDMLAQNETKIEEEDDDDGLPF